MHAILSDPTTGLYDPIGAVKRHHSHHKCLQTVSTSGSAILIAGDVSVSQIYRRMQDVYMMECMSSRTVFRWCTGFMQ